MHDDQTRQLRELLHALNQPLTAIGNYAQAGCQLIDSGHGDSARLRDILAKIAAQSQRSVALSRELKEALPREGDQDSRR